LSTTQLASLPKRAGFDSDRNWVSVIQNIEKLFAFGGAWAPANVLEEDVAPVVTLPVSLRVFVCIADWVLTTV
jgi:hypothetical protein